MIKIPNKSHFKANEVCSMTGVKPYVLRFWESEFDEISPLTSSSGQKLFERKDIEAIVLVKKLLFEEKLTVEKAKFEIQRIREASLVSGSSDGEVSQEALPATPDQLVSRSLEESDIEKLLLAKRNLSKMLDTTQNLQERFNWS